MQNFWIDYSLPLDTPFGADAVLGTVPVTQCDAGFYFDDGAYDAYDHLYTEEDTESVAYDAWSAIVCDIVAPALAKQDHYATLTYKINGEAWTFTRNDLRDMNGRM